MAKIGYIGRDPGSSSVIVAKQFLTATGSVGLVTFNSGYTPGYLDVFLNGVKLQDAVDYSAGDGRVINFTTNASEGDVIEMVAYKALTLGSSNVGITSAGEIIASTGVQTLNFVGAGNTVEYNSSSKTVDISIAGGGGGGLGTAIKYSDEATSSPFSYIDRTSVVTENLLLDTTKAGESESIIVSVSPNIEVVTGAAVTVGAGKTMIIDVLQIGDL